MSGEKPSSLSGPVAKKPRIDSGEKNQEVQRSHRTDDKKLIVAEKSMYKGSDSESYEGMYDSRRVFVKRFPAAKKRFFDDEAKILYQLKHDNIVECLGIRRNNEEYYDIITEFLEGGTLLELLDDCRKCSKPLPLPRAIGYALDIARAMEYVHQKKFVHRDLKPVNVLLSENQERAVLTDFGVARKQDVKGLTRAAGTPRWMAPEVMPVGKRVPYTHKADVFSFSIVLWELSTSKIPYEEQEKPMDEILAGIKENEIRPTLEDIKIPELATLLTSCWSAEPAARPEFSEIVSRLQEILHKLDPRRTSARTTDIKDQPRKDHGEDAPRTQEKEEIFHRLDSAQMSAPQTSFTG